MLHMDISAKVADRWTKAVIHLECATDSEHYEERSKRWRALSERHERGEISLAELHGSLSGEAAMSVSTEPRCSSVTKNADI